MTTPIYENLPIDGRCMTPVQFEEYIRGVQWLQPRTSVWLHHTWKPTVADWQGAKTIEGMRRTYMTYQWRDSAGNLHVGWDKGPHIFVAPDGIWLFNDIRKDGYHAGGNYNIGSIGIEMVGDYDHVAPSGPVWQNTLAVLKVLMHYLNLDESDLRFHNEVSSKTCPGTAVKRDTVVYALRISQLPISTDDESAVPVEQPDTTYRWAYKYRMLDTPDHALQKFAKAQGMTIISPEFWNDESPNDDNAYQWAKRSTGTDVLLMASPPDWKVTWVTTLVG
jgi:hypothetical protein